MSRQGGAHGMIVLGAVALSGMLAGCTDAPAGSPAQGVAVAQVQPERPIVQPVATTTATSTPATPAPVRVNVSYREAEAVYRKGDYREAAELFGSVVATNPDNAQGQYMLGLSAWKAGDHPRAEQALLRAVELDGQSVKARTNLARVLLEQAQPAAALPHLIAAVDIAPESYEVWRVLGNAHAQLGRTDEALDSYREALMRNEQDAWSMNNYALVLIQLGRFEDAIPPLARAVQLMPGSAIFLNNLGVALERTGELAAAHRAFTDAIAADGGYGKAKLSLERVEQRMTGDEGEPLDLRTFADCFAAEIQSWIAEEDHGC